MTILALQLLGANRRRKAEAAVAGLSHLVLDFLVGVSGLALLWPVSPAEFRFGHGLLPSAGAVQLSNVYFWRNLAIELFILVPPLVTWRLRRHPNRWLIAIALLTVTAIAIRASISLDRELAAATSLLRNW